ncbi:MAG TPA: nicotinate phosphoribosyltransferase, partial [Methanophagales archaeon]|nr:nicotinate phosphoribosyltransferase [Methanophagales archaeon]
IERCAYLGGMDGVSCVAGADRIGIEATGTMPHSLIICFGNQQAAWKAFDDVIAKKVPRICLCDTYYDEKTESILAAEALGESLHAVRLDTPTSRKGDFRRIIEEVRWELDVRGYRDVGIFVSGGMDEEAVVELRDLVAGFGVGTSVSNAKSIDLALDIIEREGEPCAKRGKRGGKKQVYRGTSMIGEGHDETRLAKETPPKDKVPLLKPMILNGKIVDEFSFSLEEARKRVQEQLEVLESSSLSR